MAAAAASIVPVIIRKMIIDYTVHGRRTEALPLQGAEISADTGCRARTYFIRRVLAVTNRSARFRTRARLRCNYASTLIRSSAVDSNSASNRSIMASTLAWRSNSPPLM